MNGCCTTAIFNDRRLIDSCRCSVFAAVGRRNIDRCDCSSAILLSDFFPCDWVIRVEFSRFWPVGNRAILGISNRHIPSSRHWLPTEQLFRDHSDANERTIFVPVTFHRDRVVLNRTTLRIHKVLIDLRNPSCLCNHSFSKLSTLFRRKCCRIFGKRNIICSHGLDCFIDGTDRRHGATVGSRSKVYRICCNSLIPACSLRFNLLGGLELSYSSSYGAIASSGSLSTDKALENSGIEHIGDKRCHHVFPCFCRADAECIEVTIDLSSDIEDSVQEDSPHHNKGDFSHAASPHHGRKLCG